MKTVFPEKSIKAIYKTGKNLKESSPSPAISINKNLIVVQSSTVIRDVIHALISWFLILPLNVQQRVSTTKLNELYLLIAPMWST